MRFLLHVLLILSLAACGERPATRLAFHDWSNMDYPYTQGKAKPVGMKSLQRPGMY